MALVAFSLFLKAFGFFSEVCGRGAAGEGEVRARAAVQLHPGERGARARGRHLREQQPDLRGDEEPPAEARG